MGMFLNACVFSLYIDFQQLLIFSDNNQVRNIVIIVSIVLLVINCSLMIHNVYQNFSKDFTQSPKKLFSPLKEIILPIAFACVILGFFSLLMYFANYIIQKIGNTDNTIDFFDILKTLIDSTENLSGLDELKSENVLTLTMLLALLMIFDLVLFLFTKGILAIFNQDFHFSQYISSIKLSIDSFIFGFFIIFMKSLLISQNINDVYTIASGLMLGGLMGILMIFRQIFIDAKTKNPFIIKKPKKIAYSNINEIQKIANSKKIFNSNTLASISELRQKSNQEQLVSEPSEKSHQPKYMF
jgi:hypothetical protein